MGTMLKRVLLPNSKSNTFLFDFPKSGQIMENQNQNLVFPWDILGYVKLTDKAKDDIINLLTSSHRFKFHIAKTLNVPDYWFHNFTKNEKIDTQTFKKIVDLSAEKTLLNEIVQFNDDCGSSSITFAGKFPIIYSPLWHFIFCLSVGDGHIRKDKNKFVWYQKPEGQLKIIELLNKMGFIYDRLPQSTKHGLTIPQLIRKAGSFMTKLDSGKAIRSNIIKASESLGKEYELALLCAFFMDEAGMSKAKSNSEITLHQEGNLLLLEKFGKLLTRFGISWSKNKKGDKWVIRISSEGVIQLSRLFSLLKKYDLSLLHREEVFQRKVKMAKTTLRKARLKDEATAIRKHILTNFSNKTITLYQIQTCFTSNSNVSFRLRQLIRTMKKRNELQQIVLGKYSVRGK